MSLTAIRAAKHIYKRLSYQIECHSVSSILMLFYYLAPLQYDTIMMSRCLQFTFGDKREVYLLDESALHAEIVETTFVFPTLR